MKRRYRVQLMCYYDERPFGGCLFQTWAVWDTTINREVSHRCANRANVVLWAHEMEAAR